MFGWPIEDLSAFCAESFFKAQMCTKLDGFQEGGSLDIVLRPCPERFARKHQDASIRLMPFAPTSFLPLVVRPGAPSSVLAPSNYLVAMPFAPSSFFAVRRKWLFATCICFSV